MTTDKLTGALAEIERVLSVVNDVSYSERLWRYDDWVDPVPKALALCREIREAVPKQTMGAILKLNVGAAEGFPAVFFSTVNEANAVIKSAALLLKITEKKNG